MKVNFQSGLSSGHSLSPVEETNQVTLQSLKINWLVETIVAACGKCGIMKTERSPAIKSHDEHSMHERSVRQKTLGVSCFTATLRQFDD